MKIFQITIDGKATNMKYTDVAELMVNLIFTRECHNNVHFICIKL